MLSTNSGMSFKTYDNVKK